MAIPDRRTRRGCGYWNFLTPSDVDSHSSGGKPLLIARSENDGAGTFPSFPSCPHDEGREEISVFKRRWRERGKLHLSVASVCGMEFDRHACGLLARRKGRLSSFGNASLAESSIRSCGAAGARCRLPGWNIFFASLPIWEIAWSKPDSSHFFVSCWGPR